MNKRKQFFIENIGNVLFRTKSLCPCDICQSGYKKGVLVVDRCNALCLYDYEMDLDVIYFETQQERDDFELNQLVK